MTTAKHPIDDPVVREDDVRCNHDRACLYCKRSVGSLHEVECVAWKRLVRVRFTFEMTREVPHSWDKHMIEFHLNDSSWCTSNILRDIDKQGGCLCFRLEGEFLRDADEDEIKSYGTEDEL